MPKYVVCIDGSPNSLDAAYFAALCTDAGDDVTVLQVVPSNTDFDTACARMQNARANVEQAAKVFGRDVMHDVIHSTDDTASVILNNYDGKCDVIVVGTRGRGFVTSTLFGSVSVELIKRVQYSAILVVPSCVVPLATAGVKFVCMSDGSSASQQCARRIATILHPKDKVEFVSCMPTAADFHQEVAQQIARKTQSAFEEAGGEANAAMYSSEYGTIPLQAAHQRVLASPGASVIAVGSRGLSAEKFVLGSTTSVLLHAAQFPVLVVRTPTGLQQALEDERNTFGLF